MEIERSETNFSPGIVYLSEHKKSAGGYKFRLLWANWNRVRTIPDSSKKQRSEFAHSQVG